MKSKITIYITTLISLIIIIYLLAIYQNKLNLNSIYNNVSSTTSANTPDTLTPISTITDNTASVTPDKILYKYFEVLDSCDFAFKGDCVLVRNGPSTESKIVERLRTGVVLKVEKTVVDAIGNSWYKVEFAHALLYPERVSGGWYVRSDLVRTFESEGDENLGKGEYSTSSKRILVDVSEQKFYAYEDDKLFMSVPISTGLEFTPTPRGTFPIFKMTPARYMQGPIPGVSDQVYDLPGVPWDLYFTSGGAVIHGAYWHNKFGEPWSHGCVNLTPDNAKKLYAWAVIGTKVTIQD